MDSFSLIRRNYYELVDSEKIKKIIKVLRQPDYNFRNHADVTKTIKQLEDISKRVKKNQNLVTYHYSKDISPSKYGRVHPYANLSLGALPREIRGTLAADNYIDIDITNCQPTILEQLCKKYNLNTNCLTMYVENRESILMETMETYNITRQAAKELFLILMFNGTFETWTIENAIIGKPTEFIKSLEIELQENYNFIIKHPDFKNDIEIINKANRIRESNIPGCIMAWILQNIERKILETMIYFIKSHRYDVTNVILCFDGFMMTRNKYDPSILKNIESFVLANTGYNIKLAVKPFETIELPENTVEYIAPETKRFNHETMQDCCKYSYDSAKEYFERFFVFVEKLTAFVKIDTMQQFETKKLKESFKFKDSATNKDFVKTWVEDSNRRRVEDIVFKPFSGTTSIKNKIISETIDDETVKYINTFAGFSPKINNQVTEKDITEFNDFIENYFKPVVKNLCEDNERYMDHVIKYFAQLIQHPDERPERSLVFVSDQGEGKGILMDTIKKVIGEHNFSQEPNYKEAYFSKHSNAHANKLLVNADESSAAGNFDLEGLIKSFITKTTITIDEKYQKPYELENFARMIFTSNKLMALPIDFKTGDRRFDLFKSARKFSKLRRDNQGECDRFFGHYGDVIKSDYFPALMYNYLNSIDISDWKCNALQNEITNLREEMEEIAREPYIDWFESYAIKLYSKSLDQSKNPDQVIIPTAALYADYLDYCNSNKRTSSNSTIFGRNMLSTFKFITKKHSGINYYIIDIQGYCEHFKIDDLEDVVETYNMFANNK